MEQFDPLIPPLDQSQGADSERKRLVLILAAIRLPVNIGRRFAYPFLPAISRQFGVPLALAQNVIAIQSGVGLFSPVFAPLAGRFGRKWMMLIALGLFSLASFVGAFLPHFAIFAAVMVSLGIAKMIFDPAMQAYLSDRIPYRYRGRALGITELAWPAALIIGGPLTGLLIGSAGLSAVFMAMGVLSALSLMIAWRVLPSDYPAPQSRVFSIRIWRNIREKPAALGALAYVILMLAANEIFYINFGLWMEVSFGISLATLGFLTLIIAAAEISGEVLVILLADRLGKKRMTIVGAILTALFLFAIPLLSTSLPLALLGLFLIFVTFETAWVASLSLLSEVMPEARAIMMTTSTSAAAIGRLSGALLGSALYVLTGDFIITGGIAMSAALLAVFILWVSIQETP